MSEHGDARTAGSDNDPRRQGPSAPGRRGGRKIWRIVGILAIGLALFVAAIPTIVSSTFLTSSVESNFRTAFGTDVRVDRVSLGWFRGLEVEGLVVSNPSGFPQDEPALELASLTGDISISSLFGGRLDVKGDVRGLKVHVIQRADGTINLIRQDRDATPEPTTPGSTDETRPGGHRDDVQLGDMRLALTVTDSEIRVTQEPHGVIEHLRGIRAAIRKPFGTNDFVLEFGADLGAQSAPGHVAAALDVDAAFRRPAKASLELANVDLGRYAPLLEAALPDQIDEFAGVAAGRVEATIDPDVEVVVGGEWTVTQPRISGPIVGGAKIRAPLWTVQPSIKAELRSDPPTIDTSGLAIDLGFVQAHGLPRDDTEAMLGEPGFGVRFSIDLGRVAEFGGELPPELESEGVRLEGRVAIPPPEPRVEFDQAALLGQLVLDTTLHVGRVVWSGRGFANVVVDAKAEDGVLDVRSRDGGTVDGGALELSLRADLTKLETEPVAAALRIDGAQLSPADAPALRFVIPFFAGMVPGDPHVALGGKASLEFTAEGPALPRDDQETLEWLDGWRGSGKVGLTEGAFTPAAQLGQLLDLLGQRNVLRFDAIASDFTLDAGKIATEALRLTSQGQTYGIAGSTSLAGALDYSIDISSALALHTDGARVLKYVPAEQLVAHLRGTVDDPSFAAPDIGKLIQGALQNALQEEAKKALEKKGGDLLRDLLKPR